MPVCLFSDMRTLAQQQVHASGSLGLNLTGQTSLSSDPGEHVHTTPSHSSAQLAVRVTEAKGRRAGPTSTSMPDYSLVVPHKDHYLEKKNKLQHSNI